MVHFRPDLPKSPVGKVLRKDLRPLATPVVLIARPPMDPVCHSLVGLAMGQAGLRRRTPLALSTLVLGANAPDIDVVTMATTDVWMYYRRGWTHGPLAWVVLPLALTGLMLAWDRIRAPPPPSRSAARPARRAARPGHAQHADPSAARLHEQLRHPAADAVLGPVVLRRRPLHRRSLALRHPRRGGRCWRSGAGGRPDGGVPVARQALAVATLYVAAMFVTGLWARQEVHAGLARAGRGDAVFMVTPVIANPLRREVIVDLGDRYEKGFVDFAPGPHFRPAGYGVEKRADDPLAREASRSRIGQQYLEWSRFPFFVVERTLTPPRVQLNDARYSGPMGTDGWSGTLVPVPEVPAPARAAIGPVEWTSCPG